MTDPLNEPETVSPLDTALLRIKTLEQDLKNCRDISNDAHRRHLKMEEDFKAAGTVIAWKVFLESVLYLAWLVFTLFMTFVPLWQAMIGKHHYTHLWGTVVGVISGCVFHNVIRDRPNL